MRKTRIAVALSALIVLTAACGSDDSDSAATGGSAQDAAHMDDHANMDHGHAGAACAATGPELAIEARNVKFSKDCLVAPPNQPFKITFNNEDNGIPHNVAIFKDAKMTERIFTGEVFNGDENRTYEVGPLAPGEYHFHCDVHPDMDGQLRVG